MPLFWISIAFVGGILVGSLTSLPVWAWLLLGVLSVLLGLVLGQLGKYLASLQPLVDRLPNLLWVVLLVAGLGAAYYQFVQPVDSPAFVAWYNDTNPDYIIEGIIVDPPDVRDAYTNLRVQVESLRPETELDFRPVEGLLLARVYEPGSWAYGDRLRLEGRLESPPENEQFSYRDYLAHQGIYSQMRGPQVNITGLNQGNPFLTIIYDLRARALNLVYTLWPDPEASLLAGILLGVESGIPAEVKAAFAATGTSHIIAISGFNITIVAGLFAAVFGRLFGARKGAVAAVLGIGVYTVFVGGDPAVFRAAILGGLALFANQVGRRQDGLNSLAIAAAIMALINPYVLWDVGFQLSFAATLGLILYAGPLVAGFIRLASRWLPLATAQAVSGPVGEYFLFTLAAQVTTLPIIIYYFQRLSLSAFLANPLILPAQPPIMILGGLAVILGTLFQPLGKLASPLVYPFVLYTVRLVEWIAALFGPGLYLGAVALPLVIGFYTLLFSATYWYPRLQLSPWRERLEIWFDERGAGLRSAALAGLLIVTVLVWRAGFSAPDGRLHVTFLDVGDGEGVLVQSPGGRYVLVNGGSSVSRLSDGLGRRLPAFDRRLDALVIGAPGEQQIGALADILPRFPPDLVLWSGPTHANSETRFLQQTLSDAGLAITQAQTGQALDLGGGAHMEVLATSPRGAVFLLNYGNFRLLLPLGIDFDLLAQLQDDPRLMDLSALLLADSGYGPSNPAEWLAALNPQLVVLSVAANDPQGLPDPAVLEALAGHTLLRTDRNGWIELSTDGTQMWAEAEQ